MKDLFHKIKSFFPSKKGKKSLEDLSEFLKREGGISFNVREFQDESGRYFLAESVNIPNKSIITTGESLAGLERNIKDAIFTSFEVPYFYCNEQILKTPILNKEFKIKYA